MLTLGLSMRLRAGRWLLLAMLALLHAVLLVGIASPWAHPLLLAHLGLFLLWQPVWRGERRVGRDELIFIGLAVAGLFWLNWWVVAFWLIGLFGLIGGRVLAHRSRWGRWYNLAVMVYLLTVLLLWVVPNLFADAASIQVGRTLIEAVLPPLLLIMALLPANDQAVDRTQSIDFIYSLLLFMLLTLVVLGSLAFMTLAHVDYLGALMRTLFLVGAILLALGGLWDPRFGFNGLRVVFSRYLLNVGTPFESWLLQLAEVAQSAPDAASYLARATGLLGELPWLSGLSWQTQNSAGQSGHFSTHAVVMQEAGLRLTLYAKQPLNPTVLMHVQLLTQLVGYFYQAKQREQSLRDITRLQAVYETGSRLTHDLKNMLQSLLSLTAIAQSSGERAQQLLQQQLPLLSGRIEQTLLKLQQTQADSATPLLPLNAWWDALQQRNQHRAIEWHAPAVLEDFDIPSALFDCVLDNLLDNAVRKRQFEAQIVISVTLQLEPYGQAAHRVAGDRTQVQSGAPAASVVRITVCDSGAPVEEMIAANLLRAVVVSPHGLGIGLYQAARWAEQLGYRLSLSSNQAGSVCFELRG